MMDDGDELRSSQAAMRRARVLRVDGEKFRRFARPGVTFWIGFAFTVGFFCGWGLGVLGR